MCEMPRVKTGQKVKIEITVKKPDDGIVAAIIRELYRRGGPGSARVRV